MPILETARLLLRRFTPDDLDEVYRLFYADPVVKDAWSRVTGTPEAIKARFAQRHILPTGPFGLRALALKDTGALIGLMGFQRHAAAVGADIWYLQSEDNPNRSVSLDPDFVEVELTYALGRAYWKQGYTVEMGRALIPYGFNVLGIGRIIQGARRDNPNSVNLMRRLGFRIENGIDPGEVVGILEPGDRPASNR
jgi:ribosomal-protein-alanine N-acetyltransferase